MTQTTTKPSQAALIQLDIEFDGTPRSLATIAQTLDKVNITIVSSTSQQQTTHRTARWEIIADITPSPYGLRELQSTLAQLPEILTVTIAAIARSRLHL